MGVFMHVLWCTMYVHPETSHMVCEEDWEMQGRNPKVFVLRTSGRSLCEYLRGNACRGSGDSTCNRNSLRLLGAHMSLPERRRKAVEIW